MSHRRQKSTGGASQAADPGQHLLPCPLTTPGLITLSSCGASQPATVLVAPCDRLVDDPSVASCWCMTRVDGLGRLRRAIWCRVMSIRWRKLVHSMFLKQMGMQGMLPPSWRAAFRAAVLRQLVDQRLDGGPCPRLVPAEDSRRTSAVPNPWDDYLDEEVDGPAPPYPTCNAFRRLCACSRGCTVPVFGEQVVCDFCSVETSPQPHCVCVGVGYECCEHDLSDGGEKAAEE